MDVQLSLKLNSANLTFVWNADAYAVGVQANASVQTDPAKTALSAMVVATPLDATKTRVKDNLTTLGSGEPLGFKTISGATLTDVLNDAYDNGNNAGKYLFFRINPDASALSDNQHSMVASWRVPRMAVPAAGASSPSTKTASFSRTTASTMSASITSGLRRAARQ